MQFIPIFQQISNENDLKTLLKSSKFFIEKEKEYQRIGDICLFILSLKELFPDEIHDKIYTCNDLLQIFSFFESKKSFPIDKIRILFKE